MPSMLGKRKNRPADEQEDEDAAAAAARELLRKHFEARFKPVAEPAPASRASKARSKSDNADPGSEDGGDYYDDDEDEDYTTISDESDEDEWGGLSGNEDGDDDTPQVEVVDHTSSSQPANILTMSKKELKAYLVCIFHSFFSVRFPRQSCSS